MILTLSHPMATLLARVHPDPGFWGLRPLGARQDGLDYAVTQPWKLAATAAALAVLRPRHRTVRALRSRLACVTP